MGRNNEREIENKIKQFCAYCRRPVEYIIVYGCLEGHLGDIQTCTTHKEVVRDAFEQEKRNRAKKLPAATRCFTCNTWIDEYLIQPASPLTGMKDTALKLALEIKNTAFQIDQVSIHVNKLKQQLAGYVNAHTTVIEPN